MTRISQIVRDNRGAAIIEFALVLPVLVLFLYGTFVIGQLFEANAGMQHALGEGARYATICHDPDVNSGCRALTADEIEDRMNETVFEAGLGGFTVDTPDIQSTHVNLTVHYTMPMNFIFFSLPDVTMTQTKKVYTA